MDELDRASNYAAMGEGYKLAALRLVDSLLEDNACHDADAVIFPVLFCAHQSIELYLKAAEVAVCESLGTNPWTVNLLRKHNLECLLSSLNSCINEDRERLRRNSETAQLFKLIDLLKTIGDDKNGSYYVDFARYPEKQAGQSYLFVKDDNLVFELPEIRDLIENGCDLMEGFYFLWQERADYARTVNAF